MKIAHFSDVHFSHFVKNPLQFLSKTWIGNANLLLKRGQKLQPLQDNFLLETLKDLKPDLCLFTGDFTTTSQPKEFERAQTFIDAIKNAGYNVLTLPGNHDHYTKKAYKKKLFYHYLANKNTGKEGDLNQSGYEIYQFCDTIIILLDLTLATPWFTAYGMFHQHLESIFEELASRSPQKQIVVAGHFPLLKTSNSFHPALKKGDRLWNLLKDLGPIYYLHGHNHNFHIIGKESLLQIDSGSLSDIYKGSFQVLDTQANTVTPFFRKGSQFIKGAPHAR